MFTVGTDFKISKSLYVYTWKQDIVVERATSKHLQKTNIKYFVRVQVLTAITMSNTFFWDVESCNPV
jgi:hypothetical protein